MAATLAGAATAQGSSEKELHEKAKKDGELTWYVAQFNQKLSEEIGQAFTARYPGVKVNVIRSTSAVAYNRLQLDLKAGVVQSDVFSSANIGHYVTLKQEGKLERHVPANAAQLIDKFKNVDPDGMYHITYAAITTITYNKDKVKEADLPKNWTDLLAPRWANQVGTGHPGFSGTVGIWCVLMDKLYGGDFFIKLAAQKPQVGRSIDDTVAMLNSGERSVAIGDLSFTLQNASKGNPLGVTYPSDGALLSVAPSAIIKGAKHQDAAKLFINFLMSAEVGKLTASQFELPIRPDVAPPPGAKPMDQIKTQLVPADEIAKGVPIVTEKWRNAFGS